VEKRLYRSTSSKIVGGVCGGIAEYLGLDPTLVRIITVLLFFLPGIGLLTYIIAWIIIPLRPPDAELSEQEQQFSSWNKYLPGLILIGLGMLLLLRAYSFYFDWGGFWAVVLIILGLALIFSGRLRRRNPTPQEPQAHRINDQNGGQVV
jgi:phage shock protein C